MPNFFSTNIKSFVLGRRRITPGQKHALAQYSKQWCVSFNNLPLDLRHTFNSQNPVVVDIGFGMGDEVAHYALSNPNLNVLGIEVYKPGIGSLLRKIHFHNIKNLKIIEADARDVFEFMIPNDAITGVHVYFPDPWPKKKHKKRRLLQIEFLKLLELKLMANGSLEFLSDNEDYTSQVRTLVLQNTQFKKIKDDLVTDNGNRINSKFELKARATKSDVFQLSYLKTYYESNK